MARTASRIDIAPPRFQLFLYVEDGRCVAEVPQLAGCKGVGASYAQALRRAERAIDAWLQAAAAAGLAIPVTTSADKALKALRRAMPASPSGGRKLAPVKLQLLEKFGKLSNRELATRIGVIAVDAPVMLSSAAAGKGTRRVRCAIALALGQPPSSLWPARGATLMQQDDATWKELRGDYSAT